MLFSYIGPETMLPMASIITGIVGVFLMFGRNIMAICRGMVRRILPAPKRTPVTSVSPTPEKSVPDPAEVPSES